MNESTIEHHTIALFKELGCAYEPNSPTTLYHPSDEVSI